MARITFITYYNDFSVGVNVLSRVLIEDRHDVSTIFFKLPGFRQIKWFQKDPGCFEAISSEGEILGSNQDVNKPTDCETKLLTELVLELDPDILCISTRTPDHDVVLQTLPLLRKQFKGVILAGGYGPTFAPETYVDVVDYVFRGEAENRIAELISKIERGESIEEFDNICYRKNGKIVINKLGAPEELPLKKQTITKKSFYIENNRIYTYEERNELIRYPNAYSIFFGRGCISTCSYCTAGNWRNLYKREGYSIKARRNRQIEDVIDELISIKDTGITFVNFRDEFLTAKVSELKSFFRLYEREICIPFWAYLVPMQVLNDPEILEMAVNAGFVDTVVAFQSGSDYINRTYFTRLFSNKENLEYAHLLAKYHINMKFDFILFNPAETREHMMEAFKLLQVLPKKRSYVNCSRLFYLPGTPACELFAEYRKKSIDFEAEYAKVLLYLICFVLPEEEFYKLLKNEQMTSSWRRLKEFYTDYLKKHNIDFPIGTHEIPDSITTHRYQRILKKQKYPEIIIWGAGDYYKKMAGIFGGSNIRYHIEERDVLREGKVSSPSILADVKEPLPIFICAPQKREIKIKMHNDLPDYPGKIYV
jgi:radical SAM superfamily enzyme YgiQ (UPF0313 family)